MLSRFINTFCGTQKATGGDNNPLMTIIATWYTLK